MVTVCDTPSPAPEMTLLYVLTYTTQNGLDGPVPGWPIEGLEHNRVERSRLALGFKAASATALGTPRGDAVHVDGVVPPCYHLSLSRCCARWGTSTSAPRVSLRLVPDVVFFWSMPTVIPGIFGRLVFEVNTVSAHRHLRSLPSAPLRTVS